MIANLIGGFVAILIGVSLVGPISTEVNTAAATGSALYNSSGWGSTVLKLVPGFFALGILGIGIAVNKVAPRLSNLPEQKHEFRLKSSRRQDRSVTEYSSEYPYARTTDKWFHDGGMIYSLFSGYKMKPEINNKPYSSFVTTNKEQIKNLFQFEASGSCLNTTPSAFNRIVSTPITATNNLFSGGFNLCHPH
jgi:hypothetical protein